MIVIKSSDAANGSMCTSDTHQSKPCVGATLRVSKLLSISILITHGTTNPIAQKLQENMQLIERLIRALPDTVDVGGAPPSGPKHMRKEDKESSKMLSLQELLRNIQIKEHNQEKSKVSCTSAVGRAQSVKLLTKLQVSRPSQIFQMVKHGDCQVVAIMPLPP